MGYFDSMKVMLGKGMNAADRKTQELRLQTELNRVDSSLESAYAVLGKVVYSHPNLAAQIRSECSGEYDSITSLLSDEQEIKSKIEGLRRQVVAAAPSAPRRHAQLSCPRCGMTVTLDLSYCPNCGDNLSELKQNYRLCPNCATYYASDSMFCMQCGTKTIEVPVAIEVSEQSDRQQEVTESRAEHITSSDGDFEKNMDTVHSVDVTNSNNETKIVSADDKAPQVDQASCCPSCGTTVAADDVFCSECGAKLVE